MNVNKRLFNQYFIREDEVYSHKKKVESINERIKTLSGQLTEQGWKTHTDIFVAITDWIGVHSDPTADNEKNKRWVNLPSQELVGYLNRLWELSKFLSTHTVHVEVSVILIKLQATPF